VTAIMNRLGRFSCSRNVSFRETQRFVVGGVAMAHLVLADGRGILAFFQHFADLRFFPMVPFCFAFLM